MKKSVEVRTLFDAVARRYDLLNSLLSAGADRMWRRAAVRLSGARPGDTVLDLCTGTGKLAQAFADTGCTVTAVDFSLEMLRLAARSHSAHRKPPRETAAPEGIGEGPNGWASRQCYAIRTPRSGTISIPPSARGPSGSRAPGTPPSGTIDFVAGDATSPPLLGRFDIVSIAFGLRNLENPRRGIETMRELAKPGGRIVVLELVRPTGLRLAAYRFYLDRLIPILGGLLSRRGSVPTAEDTSSVPDLRSPPYRYLADSVLGFWTAEELGAAIESSGMRASLTTRSGGIVAIGIGSVSG